jgi:hypothetical protein
MAVSEKSTGRGLLSTNIWAVGVRQIVYMALGAALYGGLSWSTNALQLPSAGNVSLRPAIVIPLFFGAVFGPWVGLFTGGIGNLLGDYVSGYGVFWNWDVGNALLGFIAGLTLLRTGGATPQRAPSSLLRFFPLSRSSSVLVLPPTPRSGSPSCLFFQQRLAISSRRPYPTSSMD